MQVYAHHGVLEQERRVGNLFEVSVRLEYDFTTAGATDDLSKAINYAEVAEIVKDVMARPRQLLEAVAVDLHDTLVDRYRQVTGGSITVSKPHPPMPADVESASATICW